MWNQLWYSDKFWKEYYQSLKWLIKRKNINAIDRNFSSSSSRLPFNRINEKVNKNPQKISSFYLKDNCRGCDSLVALNISKYLQKKEDNCINLLNSQSKLKRKFKLKNLEPNLIGDWNSSEKNSNLLKSILESSKIIKIVESIPKFKKEIPDHIKLWNVFDLTIAHDVIHYQKNGKWLEPANNISISQMKCFYRIRDFKSDDELSSMIALYKIMKNHINADYLYLFRQKLDIELLKGSDNNLVELKNDSQIKFNSDFEHIFCQLNSSSCETDKGSIHEILALIPHFENPVIKSVLVSPKFNSVNIKFSNKFKKLKSHINLHLGNKQNHNSKINMVNSNLLKLCVNLKILTNAEKLSNLVDKLRNNSQPVLLCAEFIHLDRNYNRLPELLDNEKIALRLKLLNHREIRVLLNEETIKPIGELFESQNITKLTLNHKHMPYRVALRLMRLNKFRPINCFDLCYGFRCLDYIELGYSIEPNFISNKEYYNFSHKSMDRIFNTSKGYGGKFNLSILFYQYLLNNLPSEIFELFKERSSIAIQFESVYKRAKCKRLLLDFKLKTSSLTIHVIINDNESQHELFQILSQFEHTLIYNLNRTKALITFKNYIEKVQAIELFKLLRGTYKVNDIKDTKFYVEKTITISDCDVHFDIYDKFILNEWYSINNE